MNIIKRVARIFAYFVFALSIVGLVFCGLSSDKLVFTNYTLNSDKISHEFSCLVISDYHHRSLEFKNGNMLDQLREQGQVDYVFLTGDLIDSHTKSLDDANKILNVAKSLSNNHVYFVTGNHEEYAPLWNDLKTLMDDKGINYLCDRETVVDNIHIFGLEDVQFKTKGSFKEREAKIKETLDQFTIDKNNFNVLLVHRPENFKLISNYGFDMVVSGHTHGGQVKIGNWVPTSIFLEEGEYIGGEYVLNSSHLYVSKGLGYSAMAPIRVNCDPEILKITVK